MDEYGDMLSWSVPKADGACRTFHVFHPDWCSFSDAFKGTVHYHGGWIRGTLLAGHILHDTYQATRDSQGDRQWGADRYTLARHTSEHSQGDVYHLEAFVPHWIRPTSLTVTHFEEEDNGEMGDLLEPISAGHDEHRWEQADAEALLPVLMQMCDARLAALQVIA